MSDSMRLYFFSCGSLRTYRYMFINNGGNEQFSVPDPFFLIQHKGRNVLFDTGCHPGDRDGHLSPEMMRNVTPVFDDSELAPNAIFKVGLKPEDIDFVVLSHLHFDHAGTVAEFPNATVIVQQAELDYMRSPDYFMRSSYYMDEAPLDLDWYPLDGWNDDGFDLFNDGKVVVRYTPGHTPGHQSLLVNTDNNGSFLLAADACYTKENMVSGLLPGLVSDSSAFLRNLRLFKLMEKTGTTIVSGHDPAAWEGYRHAPDYYD